MKLTANLDRVGTIGLFFAAMLTPCCFPLFGFFLAAFGLGSVELFGGWTAYIFETLVLITLIGLFISYRNHNCTYPLLIAVPGAAIIFYAYNFSVSEHWNIFIYSGMFGLMAATLWNYQRNKFHGSCGTCNVINGKIIEFNSTITCPNCGYKKSETMPIDACQFFYQCENCQSTLRPNKGDCCVYCSYGTIKCPSKQ